MTHSQPFEDPIEDPDDPKEVARFSPRGLPSAHPHAYDASDLLRHCSCGQ